MNINISNPVDRTKDSKQVKIVFEGPELKLNSQEYNEKIAVLLDNIKKLNGYVSKEAYSKWIKQSREWASKNCNYYDDCHFDCERCYYAFINKEKE